MEKNERKFFKKEISFKKVDKIFLIYRKRKNFEFILMSGRRVRREVSLNVMVMVNILFEKELLVFKFFKKRRFF